MKAMKVPACAGAGSGMRRLAQREIAAAAEAESSSKERQRWHRLPPVPPSSILLAQEPKNPAGLITALKWAALCRPALPQDLLHRLFRDRKVRLLQHQQDQDMQKVAGSSAMQEGDVLCFPEPVIRSCRAARRAGYVQGRSPAAMAATSKLLQPEQVRASLLYQDPELLLLSKPGGGVDAQRDMAPALRGTFLPSPSSFSTLRRPALMQGLDPEASGVVTFARTAQGAAFLQEVLSEKEAAAVDMDVSSVQDAASGRHELRRAGLVEHVLRSFRHNPLLHPYWSLEMGSPEQLQGRVYATRSSSVLVTNGKLPNKIVVADVERRFWALVVGNPPGQLSGLISAPLRRIEEASGMEGAGMVAVAARRGPGTQEALTEYRVLGEGMLGCTWMELTPLTDCLHQVRVHCASVLGMPIVGDYRYGWREHEGWPGCRRKEVEEVEEEEEEDVVGRRREDGDVLSEKPGLHLHCRVVTLPNVDGILFSSTMRRSQNSVARPLSNKLVERLKRVIRITAPLPPHMLASWHLKHLPNVFLTKEEYPGWRGRGTDSVEKKKKKKKKEYWR